MSPDIPPFQSDQYVADYETFARNAKSYTQKYAMPSSVGETASVSSSPHAPPPLAPTDIQLAAVATSPPEESESEAISSVPATPNPSPNSKKRRSDDSPDPSLPSQNEAMATLPTAKKPKFKEQEPVTPQQEAAGSQNPTPTPSTSAALSSSSISQSPKPIPTTQKVGLSLGFSKKS